VGRDAHKSVIAGLVLSGLQPIWVRPRWDAERHLAHPPSPADVAAAFDNSPDASGILITSPTPYGTCADLASIVGICHDRGKPVIVDEAWGAHLPFHEDLPTWAMDAGADICVVSVHKMGAGFEQGSVFHVQGDLIDVDRLQACSDLLSTTSPNVLLYAAIDGWRRNMVQRGHDLLDAALQLATELRDAVQRLDGFDAMETELLGEEASHDLDRLQVVIDVRELGITGYQAADWLRAQRALDVGLSDHRRIAAQLTFADDAASAARLVDALSGLGKTAAGLPRQSHVRIPPPNEFELETVMLPRDAFFGEVETVPIQAASGRIAAEQITPYPPGIPVILPGERITVDVLTYLKDGIAAGMVIPDAADGQLETVRVSAPNRG
jgi:lysine decarboxylase